MGENRLSLKGKTAIVTGGGRGIGKAIVLAFLQEGAAVLAADIDGDALSLLEKEWSKEDSQDRIMSYVCDISNVSEIDAMVSACADRFGSIDILVNNAGILHSTPVEEITEEEWDKILAVNLKSVFFASQKVLPFMKEKGWGRIINMTSLAGRMGGYKNGLAYSASKAGIIGISRGMATRVAEYGISVNAIAPGTTESDIIKQFSDEVKEGLKNMIPLGRLGATADIANLALFLASDISGFITGAVIDINGGMYLG